MLVSGVIIIIIIIIHIQLWGIYYRGNSKYQTVGNIMRGITKPYTHARIVNVLFINPFNACSLSAPLEALMGHELYLLSWHNHQRKLYIIYMYVCVCIYIFNSQWDIYHLSNNFPLWKTEYLLYILFNFSFVSFFFFFISIKQNYNCFFPR